MFLLSSIIEVVVYFHEFYQKPTTLDGDGIVISTAHLVLEQWHVSPISVKYREKYLKRRLMYSCSRSGSYNPTIIQLMFLLRSLRYQETEELLEDLRLELERLSFL